MNLTFAPKEPDKAYIADRLWLPKSREQGDGLVRPEPVKRALEFIVGGQKGQVLLQMWEETQTHVVCPREFLPPSEYLKYRFPFVDLRPAFQEIDFADLVSPRNDEQQRAWDALAVNDNGILNLGCGKGKTVLAVKKIAQKRTPTLVVVPDGGIMEQWRVTILGDERKGLPPRIGFDGELGLIQGTTFDWRRPITLALVTTLWKRIEDGTIPDEMFRYFGFIVYDEVHQVGAPKFSLTASPFYGDRLGLTATVEREDGLDPVYRYHIGEPFYSDVTQDLVPEIFFQKTTMQLPSWKDSTVNGTVNVSRLRTMMGRDLEGNTFRYWSIKNALDQGRKILVLSHSKDQLRLMHAMFPGSGLIIAETEKAERMRVLRDSQVCFAIARLGSTGIDDDALDFLFCLTPFRSKIALQQSMGRIQRSKPDKKQPVMVVFEDTAIPPLRKMCQSMKSILRSWHFAFQVTHPARFGSLPDDVRSRYNAVLASLPARGDDDADDD